MPELPEVETIKNTVAAAISGAKIVRIQIFQPQLRERIPDDFTARVSNLRITNLRRIAKYMIMDLDKDLSILWHFGMSGKIKITDCWPQTLDKHDHLIIQTDKGVLIYNDPRRFGLITLCESSQLEKCRYLCKIGLDPWDSNLTAEYLLQKFQHKKVAIKQALLDQEIVCGIGNIYASEILYKSRIHPQRSAESIRVGEAEKIIQYTKEILAEAIAAGGSTIHDYKRPDGNIGYFQEKHCVYDKKGYRCPECTCNINKTGGIQKITQGGRSTFFCPQLQK